MAFVVPGDMAKVTHFWCQRKCKWILSYIKPNVILHQLHILVLILPVMWQRYIFFYLNPLYISIYNSDLTYRHIAIILTTNLAAVVCVYMCVDVCQCAKVDQFLPARSHFESKRSENFVRIAKFPYAAFGPLFAFHCPLFFTRNNDLE